MKLSLVWNRNPPLVQPPASYPEVLCPMHLICIVSAIPVLEVLSIYFAIQRARGALLFGHQLKQGGGGAGVGGGPPLPRQNAPKKDSAPRVFFHRKGFLYLEGGGGIPPCPRQNFFYKT